MQKKHLFFLIMLVWAVGTQAQAQIVFERNGKISYQGKLEQDGKPFTGNISIEFKIMGWNEIQTVKISKGLYAVLLGEKNPLPDTLFKNNKELELEIYVSGQKLSPSVKIHPVPFAYKALQVEKNAIGSDQIQSQAILARHLSPDAMNLQLLGHIVFPGSQIAPNSLPIDRLQSGGANRMIMTNTAGQPFWADFTTVANSLFAGNVPLEKGKIWIGNDQGRAEVRTLHGDIEVDQYGKVTVLRAPQSNVVISGGGGTTTTTVTATLTNGSVTNSILADNSVTTNKILDNTILPQDLALATASAVMTTNTAGQPQWISNAAFASLLGGWSMTGNAGINPATNFIGTTDANPLIFKVDGKSFMSISTYGGLYLEGAAFNVFIGKNAGQVRTTGGHNVVVGSDAGKAITSGSYNVILGQGTGIATNTGSSNVMLGYLAGLGNTTGNNNIYIGQSAGQNSNGTGNIFIGNNAGLNEIGSSKLYIENTNTATPLIYGDFSKDFVSVNGNLAMGYSSFATAFDGMMAFRTGGFYGYVGSDWHKFATVGSSAGDNLGNHVATQDIVLGTNRIGNLAGATGLSFDGSNNATLGAGLTVNGNSFFTGYINFSPAFKFEGNAINGIATNLLIEEPSATNNITLPNKSGTVVLSDVAGNTFITGNLQVGFNATPTASGMISYQTDNFYGYSGTAWYKFATVSASGGSIMQGGNSFSTAVDIGTNDNQSLVFRANGQMAGKIDLGGQNTFFGNRAGRSATGLGANVFLGEDAGQNTTTGGGNVFIGKSAGQNNITGGGNILIGLSVAPNNTAGINSVMIGYQAGVNSTGGDRNQFIGYQAGRNNTTGIHNSFMGANAGDQNTTGKENIAIGYSANSRNTTGDGTVALGFNAGINFQTINNSVFIGNLAGGGTAPTAPARTGNVFIGYSAGFFETGSDKLYIDNSNTTTPLIYGDFALNRVGINRIPTNRTLEVGGSVEITGSLFIGTVNTTGGAASLFIGAGGEIVQTSDLRLKTNVLPLKNALISLDKINGKQYNWKALPNKLDFGVIAQDLEKIYPNLVLTDEKGYKSVNYIGLVPVLIEAVKELNTKVESLETENQVLKAQVAKQSDPEKAQLKEKVESLEQRLQRLERLLEDKARKE